MSICYVCRREIDASFWTGDITAVSAALSALTPALQELPMLRRLGMSLSLTGTLPADWAAPNSLLRYSKSRPLVANAASALERCRIASIAASS